jgi:hypothetical protein
MTNTDQYYGKEVQLITDRDGNELSDLVMCDNGIVIHFTDGTKLALASDWRGDECYISQYQPPLNSAND